MAHWTTGITPPISNPLSRLFTDYAWKAERRPIISGGSPQTRSNSPINASSGYERLEKKIRGVAVRAGIGPLGWPMTARHGPPHVGTTIWTSQAALGAGGRKD